MLEKSWVDHDVITIPAESMKKRRQHRVPLSGGTASIGSGFVNGQFDFDASQDDATYAYDKLQVASLQTLACIKF